MSKVNIRITIINDEENRQEEVRGILQDNTLKYKENDGTTVIYDYLKNSLSRENDELKMTYYFENNKKKTGTIFIKDIEKKIEIDIETKKIIKNKNNIEIKYKIEDNIFKYRIEVII